MTLRLFRIVKGEKGASLLASLVNLQGVIIVSTTLHYELSSRISELMTLVLYMSNVKLAFHALVLFV